MRPPLAQPITLDFDQVWLIKTPRGRALLDVLSSGEVSALLAGKVSATDSRLFDSRHPLAHGSEAHDSTVEATANKGVANGYCDLDATGKVPSARLPSTGGIGFVPVGAVIAWHKSFTGTPALPSEFHECDGSVIADAGSPMNGQTLPDLNGGNRFLRGNSTSGATGGDSTHNHGLPVDTGWVDGAASAGGGYTTINGNASDTPTDMPNGDHVHNLGGATDPASTLPPYIDVLWIMRIR